MTRKQLDVPALYATVDAIRRHDGLTWKQLAARLGLSASTFTRMAAGHGCDADALCTLIGWLRMPLDRFTVDAPQRQARNRKATT
jgi:transcriptional regulator with XRE-family HTH domain